jgi:hypothetical protein
MMFHVELRHFPANFARFNLTEAQLRTLILERWVREEWVELGERKWNPQETKLTVLEGPEIPVDKLTMGRGWRNAQRNSRDVTEEVLARARERQTAKPSSSASDLKLQADSLGLEVLSALGGGRITLRHVWKLGELRSSGAAPSRSLALAEGAVRSLLRSSLIVILADAAEEDAEPTSVPESEHDTILETLDSWASSHGAKTIWISRS